MTIIIEAQNLLKNYAGATVLQADSLAFEQGAITAVCGQNGAGKSTLLRLIALLEYPDRGEIIFKEKQLQAHGDWFVARKAISMVDQNPYVYSGTVFDNVAYGIVLRRSFLDNAAYWARIRSVYEPGAKERVAEALAAVGLEGFERRKARTLSGGEAQRMAIARAIVCDPDLLVLDEPTAHVDADRVRDVEQLILQLRDQKGVSIIIATHDHHQAAAIADRVLWIEKGKISEQTPRIIPANLKRIQNQLVIETDQNITAPNDNASIRALELAEENVIIHLNGAPPTLRVPLNEIKQANPLPGDTVKIKTR